MLQTDCISVCVTHKPFEYNDPKDITQSRDTSIIMKLNESNKEVKIQKKKKNLHGLELRTFWL